MGVEPTGPHVLKNWHLATLFTDENSDVRDSFVIPELPEKQNKSNNYYYWHFL